MPDRTSAASRLRAVPDAGAAVDRAALGARFPRVAIVHDWLTIPGGSEQVVMKLLELFPKAELFTSVYDPEPWPAIITDRPVHATWLNRIPGATTSYRKLLPLMAGAFERFDLSSFDLVISSNHALSKNVLTPPGTPHICYCHTPMRYAWEPRFLADEDVGGLARRALPFLLPRIRRQDLVASTRPDLFVANSTHVAARIDKYYRRDALVVHPPVEIERYRAVERRPGDYYLVLGRVVPYKRVDLAVAACARLDRRVLVAGDGRAMPLARAAAGPGAEFLGRVPDEQLPDLLAGARALLFCGEEDFGIVPVEAQAAGVPLIAYGVGGVRDSVADGETGILFEEQTVESVADAILAFEERTFEEARIRAQAEQFGPERFLDRFASVVAEHAHPSPVNR